MLVFVIPLQGPATAASWERVSALCTRTLCSVCAQDHPDFRVILVCNERPLGGFEHPALTVIERDFPVPGGDRPSRMVDKYSKLAYGLAAARVYAPAHIMLVDADDCVHPGLASLCAEHPHTNGWICESGYVWDEGSAWIYREYRNFYQRCGTSYIIRSEPEELPPKGDVSLREARYFLLSNGHPIVREASEKRGRPLEVMPFPASVYVAGHGENDSNFSLRRWRSKRILLKKLMSYRPLTSSLRERYGLQPIQ